VSAENMEMFGNLDHVTEGDESAYENKKLELKACTAAFVVISLQCSELVGG